MVGGGDSAMEEATFLTRFARSVTIVHRRDGVPGQRDHAGAGQQGPEDPLDHQRRGHRRARRHQRHRGHAHRHQDRRDQPSSPATGLFVAIGHDPRSALFRDQVATDAEGYVLTGAQVGATASTGTSVEGVFASGDLVDHIYRQAITAAGSGCAAALDAQHYVASHSAPIDVTGASPIRA